MAAQFEIVSEDLYNRSQSWHYNAVLRAGDQVTVRVEIRANAYEDQSHARVSVWGVGGWNFHTSVPTVGWYKQAPSYGKRELDEGDWKLFRGVRDELLQRLASAIFRSDEIEVSL